MKRWLLLFVLAPTLVGCEPCRHYNRLQVAAYAGTGPRKPYGSVGLVFQNPEEIKRPYTVIGMLSCEGSTGEEAGILNAMLYHAADMGADGVLLGGPRVGAEETAHMGWASALSSNRRAYRCQVIRFTDK